MRASTTLIKKGITGPLPPDITPFAKILTNIVIPNPANIPNMALAVEPRTPPAYTLRSSLTRGQISPV